MECFWFLFKTATSTFYVLHMLTLPVLPLPLCCNFLLIQAGSVSWVCSLFWPWNSAGFRRMWLMTACELPSHHLLTEEHSTQRVQSEGSRAGWAAGGLEADRSHHPPLCSLLEMGGSGVGWSARVVWANILGHARPCCSCSHSTGVIGELLIGSKEL